MTDTELRKLGRRELLQLLLEQGRELEAGASGGAEAVGRIMTRYKERAKREGVRP